MDVEKVRDALDKFDKLSDGEVLNAGSLRMFPPIVAASELVEAPRMWWCVVWSQLWDDDELCRDDPGDGEDHSGCGWVRVVKEDS